MSNREIMVNGKILPQFLPAGGGGDVSTWSTYPATQPITLEPSGGLTQIHFNYQDGTTTGNNYQMNAYNGDNSFTIEQYKANALYNKPMQILDNTNIIFQTASGKMNIKNDTVGAFQGTFFDDEYNYPTSKYFYRLTTPLAIPPIDVNNASYQIQNIVSKQLYPNSDSLNNIEMKITGASIVCLNPQGINIIDGYFYVTQDPPDTFTTNSSQYNYVVFNFGTSGNDTHTIIYDTTLFNFGAMADNANSIYFNIAVQCPDAVGTPDALNFTIEFDGIATAYSSFVNV